jgi:hypothetical protein
MTSTLDLGSNYTLEENSNGNLLIKDSTGTVVLKHTDGADFSLGAALELGDLVDGSTGDTVYDGSTETLGDGNQTADLQSVNTEKVGSGLHYASGYDGADADARLDNALSAASNSDTIYLENASYGSGRTITQNISLIGTGIGGTTLGSSLDLNARVLVKNVRMSGLTISSSGCQVVNFDTFSDITVNANNTVVGPGTIFNATVTFDSSTSGGVIDSISGSSVTVTDNGTNTVGDIT